MGVALTAPTGPLANVSTSNLAYNIPNYLCTNFGAFIKKCTIDQLIRSTMIYQTPDSYTSTEKKTFIRL